MMHMLCCTRKAASVRSQCNGHHDGHAQPRHILDMAISLSGAFAPWAGAAVAQQQGAPGQARAAWALLLLHAVNRRARSGLAGADALGLQQVHLSLVQVVKVGVLDGLLRLHRSVLVTCGPYMTFAREYSPCMCSQASILMQA